tara:strand:- start:283 stop:750 length:468 start_codon:yes stop_codon:yes gene_type:complete
MKEIATFFKSPAGQYSIVIVIAILAIWYLKDLIKNPFSTSDDVLRDPDVANPNVSNLNYPIINYTNWANRIEVALENLYNDDEQSVYEVFSHMGNNDDVLQLQKSFGTRANTPYGIGLIGGYTGTLSEWLFAQFNSSEIDNVNTILAENGITIQF